ncbi:MAG TPA: TonB-dependent receptor, partial [Terriglobales bacterium]|nr:TonB-dependent receptor [Terriglobales bacterium]
MSPHSHRSSGFSLSRRSSFFLVFVLTTTLAWAQKDTGTIAGTVRDPSGAAIPGAQVTVIDIDRGNDFKTTSNENGEYVATPLRVGHYRVSVEHPGFKKAQSNIVELSVQQRAIVDVKLKVGAATETVEVTAAAELLERETSELGEVIDSRRASNLPLNGRNFAQLALLTPGTAPSEPGARDEQNFGFSAGGARSLQNNFLLDGVDNNSNLPDLLNETNYVIQPPVEALQEFKVQTNAYSAEFGRGNGAILNAVIKSGTNSFHGSVWEFVRNEKFDARNFFDDPTQPTPPYKQNQFGGTFGGPIIKNKTFFFVDYEGLRVRQAQTQAILVPTVAQRAGDFSSQLDLTTQTGVDCNGRPTFAGEIFNTRLTQASGSSPTGLCGVPYAYDSSGNPLNVIPRGSVDPLALRLLQTLPPPNVAGNPAFNFLANPVRSETRNNFDIRVDHKFRDPDTFFARFSYEDQPSVIPSPFQFTGGDGGGFFSGNEDDSYRSLALSETHVFNPHVVNEFRFGYNRNNSRRLQFNSGTNLSADLGYPGVPFGPLNGGLPQITFGDGSAPTLGSPTFLPSVEIQNTYTLSDNVTWVKGKHTLKFGTEIRKEEFTIFQPAASRGTVDFGTQFTDNPANPGTGGSGFASYLAGLSDGGQITSLHNVDYFRQIYSFYTQDDWKVTPKLTLNLGLRYELFTTIKERNNQQGTFDFATDTLIVPRGQTMQLTPLIASLVPISATGTRGLIHPDTNNFAPRVGLAYQLTSKTVLRTAYGIFYGGQENGPYSNPSMGFNPPFFSAQSFTTPCSAASANPALFAGGNDCAINGLSNTAGTIPGTAGLFVGFPADSLSNPNTPILFSVDPNLVTPYMQQWHLTVQREMPADSVLEVGYVGSKGTKLFTFFNGNQAAPSADPTSPTAPRRPVPAIDSGIDWFRSSGSSNYNSLQARYEKRFTHGLQFQLSYTYAHSIDTASNANLGPTQNNSDFRYFRDPQAERGNSDFDVRHRFTASYLYELP